MAHRSHPDGRDTEVKGSKVRPARVFEEWDGARQAGGSRRRRERAGRSRSQGLVGVGSVDFGLYSNSMLDSRLLPRLAKGKPTHSFPFEKWGETWPCSVWVWAWERAEETFHD